MLPTPSTSHVNTDVVYEPAEDSFLLIDTISSASEIEFLRERFRPVPPGQSKTRSASPLVAEIGAGSGVVSAFVNAQTYEIFGRSDVLTLATDINPIAAKAARETVRRATSTDVDGKTTIGHGKPETGVPLASCVADLGSIFMTGSVDLLLFNPPYVPTSELPKVPIELIHSTVQNANVPSNKHLEEASLIAMSWAGGLDGMEVTNRLIDQLPRLLSPERGVAYILLCASNKPQELVSRINARSTSWTAQIVGTSGKTAGWERLVILRIHRC